MSETKMRTMKVHCEVCGGLIDVDIVTLERFARDGIPVLHVSCAELEAARYPGVSGVNDACKDD